MEEAGKWGGGRFNKKMVLKKDYSFIFVFGGFISIVLDLLRFKILFLMILIL